MKRNPQRVKEDGTLAFVSFFAIARDVWTWLMSSIRHTSTLAVRHDQRTFRSISAPPALMSYSKATSERRVGVSRNTSFEGQSLG